MTQRIILFNGPPRCGKDTAAAACFRDPELNHLPRVFERMSRPLKKAFAGTVGLPVNKFDVVEHWEDRKEEIIPGFGVSFRQWQIDFSERFMKPLYGEDIFGKLFISRAKRQHLDSVIFVPDCGFDIEYKTLVNAFGVDAVLVIKIYRSGMNFSNDSRRYLSVGSDFIGGKDLIGRHVCHVTNNGPQTEFEQKILQTVKDWLKHDPRSDIPNYANRA